VKEPELKEWACRLLEDQLMRLAELRNANPRDSGFKLWRQTSLTVIQRVWPGNLQRSERFRRIPFTPNTPRPSRSQAREHYERGCSEATAYLRELISEIQQAGVDPNQTAAPVTESVITGAPSSVAEKLSAPLPGELAQPSTGEIEKAASLPKGDAPPPLLGFLSSSDAAAPGAVPSAPPPAPVQPPVLPPAAMKSPVPPPAPPASAVETKRVAPSRAKSPRKTERRALKEMLGFVEEPAPAAPAETGPPPLISKESERPGITSQEPGAIAPASPEPVSALPVFEPAPPREPEHETELELGQETDEASDTESHTAESEPTMGEDPEEMLRSASWSAAPAPISTPATPAVALTQQNPVAATLVALASQVADLGVPEGKRAATRAALTDLARQIEDRTADWETLQDAFQLAMKYPPMARRVVPLLVPFLDLQ
jgi:hypothetical protein